ncbi:MAG TPA: hypothetical protein VN903_35610 [Polyangia bacterium]|jgi:hypothetical protein|nr:hypothetical protein [Polyangia bacterium]
MKKSTFTGAALLASMVMGSVAARADDLEDDAPSTSDVPPQQIDAVARPAAATTAAVGGFLPFAQPATLAGQRALAVGFGGYDSAKRASTVEAATEVHLFGPIAVRGAAVYTASSGTLRPSFGGRLLALREGRHGIDGAFGVFYRPEGLTEPEGEIESVISLGRHVGATYLLGSVVYGQDPEGRERDGEVHLAGVRPVRSRFLVGLDGRLRFDLGSDTARLAAHHEATLDANVGPGVAAFLGPIALSLHGGGSALRLQQTTSYGGFALIGIGTAL